MKNQMKKLNPCLQCELVKHLVYSEKHVKNVHKGVMKTQFRYEIDFGRKKNRLKMDYLSLMLIFFVRDFLSSMRNCLQTTREFRTTYENCSWRTNIDSVYLGDDFNEKPNQKVKFLSSIWNGVRTSSLLIKACYKCSLKSNEGTV